MSGWPGKFSKMPHRWRGALLTFLVLLAIFLPRAFGLDRFVTTDEAQWVVRSANFYDALGQRDFAATYLSEHPGVTVMWVGTAGFLLRFPALRGLGLAGQLDVFRYEEILAGIEGLEPESLLATCRLLMVVANTALLGLGYLYARRLIGDLPAAAGFMIVAFDPFHIALTRLLHLDGLLASFMLLSALGFLSYLQSSRPLDLAVSGIAAGLSWLTKSPGLFLVPTLLVFVVYEAAVRLTLRKHPPRPWREIWKAHAMPRLGAFVVWGCLGTLVVFLAWPAMWVSPLDTVRRVVEEALNHAAGGHQSPVFFSGRIIPSGEIGLSLFYPVMILWRSTPVALLGLAAALFGWVANPKRLADRPAYFNGLGLSIFGLGFMAFMTLGSQKFDRYILPVFLALDLVAGLGWVRFATWACERARPRWFRVGGVAVSLGILVLALGAQAFFSLQTFPYFLTYYNPLLGGIRKASEEIMIGWGEGLEQAAAYLNQKPGAGDLRVISWYNIGCFSYYFEGESDYVYIVPEIGEEKLREYVNTVDYAVIYVHQWQRQLPRDLLAYVAQKEPEHTVWIDGVAFVQIYRIGGGDS